MTKMDDDKLLDILRKKEDSAGAYVWGELSPEREKARREYYSQPYGNEEEGWSEYVASDVLDTVEQVLPGLLNIFASTDSAVVFNPRTMEDVKNAQQATDACNYVFYTQNNGFLTLYTAIKDALMVRNCAVMWRKETKQQVSYLPFKQIPADALAMSMQEGDTISEANNEILVAEDGSRVEVFTGRIKRVEETKQIKVEAFDPDYLLVDRQWVSPLLEDCPYVSRLMRVTLSDLHQMGFKDVTAEDLKASDGTEAQSNINQDNDNAQDFEENGEGPLAEGWLRIEFVLVDVDGDGIAERRIIYRLENKILSNEVTDHVQIATASPILNTHRWDGMSIWDLVASIQRLDTEVTRQTLNNLYLTNNPRKKVLTDSSGTPRANIDDLLDARPGGILRTQSLDAISDDVTPFAAGASLPVLEFVQQLKESRTGVSRRSQGLDKDALDNTATGRRIDQSASMQRQMLVARIFAEVLLKPVFKGILRLLTDGGMEKLAFRLRNEFVEYDPNEWRDNYDLTIGIGSVDAETQVARLTMILQGQKELLPIGLATKENVYYAACRLVESAGFKDVQNFLTDPKNAPPQEPQEPIEIQLKRMELEAKDAQDARRHAERMAELEANLKLQASNDMRDAERQRQQMEMNAELQAMRAEYEDRWKELDANVKVLVSQINQGLTTGPYLG